MVAALKFFFEFFWTALYPSTFLFVQSELHGITACVRAHSTHIYILMIDLPMHVHTSHTHTGTPHPETAFTFIYTWYDIIWPCHFECSCWISWPALIWIHGVYMVYIVKHAVISVYFQMPVDTGHCKALMEVQMLAGFLLTVFGGKMPAFLGDGSFNEPRVTWL